MVPRCQKCNADRRKVIIVRNGVGHVTDLELDVSGALSQCPSGDPAQQVQQQHHTDRRYHRAYNLKKVRPFAYNL